WLQGYPAMATVPVNVTAAGALTLTGDGSDIWNNSDDFIFAYKTLTGDGSIVARVLDKGTGTNPWGKGGVMIRGGLTGGAPFADMLLSDNSDGSASYGYSFQWRPAPNAGATSTDGVAPTINVPYWVKVQRTGDTLAGYTSADGKTWKMYGSPQNIVMGSTVYLGLCVTSGVPGELRTFKFDGIATTGNVSGTWQGAGIVGVRNNVAAPLYVTVEDKVGKKKTVVNPDAAAVTNSTWTQWKIPFSDLSGVNVAAVKKLTIGVGDPAHPQAGATGMLYIDDIGFGKTAVPDLTNYATNGGFETGTMEPWGSYGSAASAATATVVKDCAGAAVAEGPAEGTYCLNVKVSGPGTNFWDSGFSMTGPTFTKGTKYTLSAFFKTASGTGKINFKPEHAGGNWEGYGEQQITITDKWTEYHVTTPVFTSDVSPTSLTFHIGFQAQEFWVDNIKFYEGDYVPSK
ncbi:MAG: carbohydrate binding domain-containing protein, partial [Planctomycetes bacterium]|nr:carbohydrate binding domain-containing protein [Planctomycetota bacterium]